MNYGMATFLNERSLIGKSTLNSQSRKQIKEERLPVEYQLYEETDKCEGGEIKVKMEPPLPLEEYPVFEIVNSIKCEEKEESDSFELSMTTDPLCLDNVQVPTNMGQGQGTTGQCQIQFLCGLCQIPFVEESSLMSHLSTHNEEKKLFNCSDCSGQFRDHEDFQRHLRVHNRYKCNQYSCVKSFTRESDLIKHLKTHVENPSIYICKYCAVQTSSKAELDKHLLIHTSETPTFYHQIRERLECPMCDKIFSSKKDLTAHLKRIHVCANADCSKSFYLRTELDAHVKQCHKKKTEKKSHTCETCNQSFAKKYYLNTHRLLHTGKPLPFKCDRCEKSYLTRLSLNFHYRSHTQTKRPLSDRLL